MTSYDVVIFGIHLTLKPVAFTLPIGSGWDIYWYGIIIATGFLAALLYAFKKAPVHNINTDRMIDVVLVTTPLAILCARGYYVIFDPNGKIESVSEFFGLGNNSGFAGLAIYGGVIGALVVGAVMCKIRKVNTPDMFDLALTCFLLAQGIGRWGNFMNQEAYGTFTGSTFWGMQSNRTISELGAGLVHPCFLYESIWCIAGFFLLNYLGKKKKYPGQITLCYGVWYGFGRMIIEMLRTDSLMIGKVRVSCLLSAVVCIGCAVWLFVKYKKSMPLKQEHYDKLFEEKGEKENEQTD